MSAELTLGAEEELHLIDLESWSLSARAPQVLSRLPGDNYSAEIQRTTVETNTDVVSGLGELRTELVRLRRGLAEVAAAEGLGIASAGTAPRSVFADFELTATGRYGRMQEQYRLLVDEQLICGLQIHVGVSNRDLAVQIMQRVARHLPILLALSASSPFWNGQDTGLLQHPDDHLAALAQCRRDRPDRVGPGVRGAARRPDQQRGHRRPQDGLLRCPAVGPCAHPGAAGLRRLPDRRRRHPDRRAVPWPGPGGGARDRGGEAVRAVPRPDPPGGDLAGGPGRVDR